MSVGVTGRRSNITRKFVKMLDTETPVIYGTYDTLPKNLNTYLLCAGVLIGKRLGQQTYEEILKTFNVNYLQVVEFLDKLFDSNPHAKVCVIGSMSGINGSFDMAYAGSKAALHTYVKSKRLIYPGQNLTCVAPTIIRDTGMTVTRVDLGEIDKRGKKRRLGRWLTSEEIARVAYMAIGNHALCNTVIEATGGNW